MMIICPHLGFDFGARILRFNVFVVEHRLHFRVQVQAFSLVFEVRSRVFEVGLN
jgi:hypothetical protein